MRSVSSMEAKRIPLGQKVAFGVGMLANQMFPAALGIFMVILVQSLGMSPFLWGLIFSLPKLVDYADSIMGFISDRTVSRWGKRRPYVFIGAILSGLSYMAMWQLSADKSQLYNFVYFLCWSSVFFIGLTIFSVPYVAMGYEMSDDYHERTRPVICRADQGDEKIVHRIEVANAIEALIFNLNVLPVRLTSGTSQ